MTNETRTWQCDDSECNATVERDYEMLAEAGNPYCPKCDGDMHLTPAVSNSDIVPSGITRVANFKSNRGEREVPNQFRIWTREGVYFQSYQSIIVFAPYMGKKVLDAKYWDYSTTTGKYRNQFLGEDKAETLKKIKEGVYILADLNKGE